MSPWRTADETDPILLEKAVPEALGAANTGVMRIMK